MQTELSGTTLKRNLFKNGTSKEKFNICGPKLVSNRDSNFLQCPFIGTKLHVSFHKRRQLEKKGSASPVISQKRIDRDRKII
jgi:hypothetical protein